MIWIPTYFRTVYDLNRDRGRYELTVCPPGFTAVPPELTVEERRYNQTINADLLLQGPKTGKNPTGKPKADFFTGLQSTGYADVYTGSVQKGRTGKVVRSFLIVRFTPNANTLTMLYLPSFGGPYPNQRHKFVAELIGRGLL